MIMENGRFLQGGYFFNILFSNTKVLLCFLHYRLSWNEWAHEEALLKGIKG